MLRATPGLLAGGTGTPALAPGRGPVTASRLQVGLLDEGNLKRYVIGGQAARGAQSRRRGTDDFRDELSFHAQLADTQRLLEQTPGVGADVFQPDGAPPAEWLEP